MMTAPMQLERSLPSIFNIIANASKDVSKKISDTIHMTIIHSLRKEQEELNEKYNWINDTTDALLNININEMYDDLLIKQTNIVDFAKVTQEHKNESDILMQVYLANEELLNDYTIIIDNLTNIEIELIHQKKLDYAV